MSGAALARLVARGTALTYGAFLASRFATFVGTLVLARLLVPRDFGLVGYALLVLGFLFVVKNLGMGTAVVYRQDLTRQVAGEIFGVAMLGGLVFLVVAWLVAPFAASFFHDGRITLVTRVLALSFVIGPLGDVHNAHLQKSMQFGRRVLPRLLASVAKAAIAIVCALAGLRYWSLVWGQLGGDVVATLTSWILYPWLPALGMRRASLLALLRFGAQIAVLETFGFALLSVDNLIVGRTLGGAALGLYAIAFTIPQMVTIGLSGAISQAVFPAFATMQSDPVALSAAYARVLRYSSLLLLPVGLGLLAVAPAFVHAFYTAAWWPMVPAAQALALYATIYAIGSNAQDVFLALGRPSLQWKLDGAALCVLVPALVVGAHLGGIAGVARAQVAVMIPYALVRHWLLRRTIGISFATALAALRVPAFGGVALLAACVAAGRVVNAGPGAELALQVVAGGGAYVVVVASLDDGLRRRFAARLVGLRPRGSA